MNATEWFLLLAPQGRRVLSHPGRVSPFGPSSQPSPSFLGVHVRKKKKSIPPAEMFACAMCQHTHAPCATVCVCTHLSPKQLLFFDCSTSIALPSVAHVAELLCEGSVAPERLPLLRTDARWCARVDKGAHTQSNTFPAFLAALTVKLLQITIIVPELRHAKCRASRLPFIHPQQNQSLSDRP